MKPPLQYDCHHIDEPIEVDGSLGAPQWQQAELISLVLPVTHEEPLSKTEGRLLWDDRCLYVGFKAYDKDIFSYFTERDSRTCEEDVLEMFLKPEAAKDPYYNFEIN
jgi:hypothetical protein